MSLDAKTSPDGARLTVSLLLQFRRRGGRKQVMVPDGRDAAPFRKGEIDSTLVKALARAHRWRRMLEGGAYASIAELASAERINASYVARVLRLTLLALTIVECILEGRHDRQGITLNTLLKPFPAVWDVQSTRIWSPPSASSGPPETGSIRSALRPR